MYMYNIVDDNKNGATRMEPGVNSICLAKYFVDMIQLTSSYLPQECLNYVQWTLTISQKTNAYVSSIFELFSSQ